MAATANPVECLLWKPYGAHSHSVWLSQQSKVERNRNEA